MDPAKLARLENESEYPEPVRTEWKILARIRIWEPNASVGDIARSIGYSYHSVRSWLRNPAYQRYENFLLGLEWKEAIPEQHGDVTARVRERYTEYAEEMQLRLLDIIEQTTDDKHAAHLMLDWLDRAGHGVVKKEQKLGVQVVITRDVLNEFKNRALEAGLEP